MLEHNSNHEPTIMIKVLDQDHRCMFNSTSDAYRGIEFHDGTIEFVEK